MQVQKDTTYYLEMLVTDKFGSPKSGLTITYTIFDSNNNSVIVSGSLTDLGNGIYKNSYLFDTLGQFRVLYTTPSNYTDEMESMFVYSETAKEQTLLKVLGLSHSNYRIFSTNYDVNGNLLSTTVKIYPTSIDANNDTNEISIYNMVATYNVNNQLTSYKVTD